MTDKSQTRGPDYRTKPVANDLLKELLATPGGIKQMSDAAQYGKLVEMRQKQAMLDRSEAAMREYQRMTQSMDDTERATLERLRENPGAPVLGRAGGVSPAVMRAVANATARQQRDLEEAGAQLQGRAVGRDRRGRPTVGGAANVGATPVIAEPGMGGGDPTGGFGRAFGIGRAVGRAGR